MTPPDIFGRPVALPADLALELADEQRRREQQRQDQQQQRDEAAERARRVHLLGTAFDALLAGQLPPADARLFLAGAGRAWLEQGGRLEDYLKVVAPKGSHLNPKNIWRRLRDEDASSG